MPWHYIRSRCAVTDLYMQLHIKSLNFTSYSYPLVCSHHWMHSLPGWTTPLYGSPSSCGYWAQLGSVHITRPSLNVCSVDMQWTNAKLLGTAVKLKGLSLLFFYCSDTSFLVPLKYLPQLLCYEPNTSHADGCEEANWEAVQCVNGSALCNHMKETTRFQGAPNTPSPNKQK